MKALGLAMMVLGALVFLAPVAVTSWAFNTYSIGVMVDGPVGITIWLACGISLVGGGFFLLRSPRSKRVSSTSN